MIRNIHIKNYLTIQEWQVNFDEGFSSITGETGAGKSLFIGALRFLLGKKLSVKLPNSPKHKTTVQAVFSVQPQHSVVQLLIQHDIIGGAIDIEEGLNIRREVLASGKTRNSIQGATVSVQILKSIGEVLIDIHAQHDNLLLKEVFFKLFLMDSIANNTSLLKTYTSTYYAYEKKKKMLAELEQDMTMFREDVDAYHNISRHINDSNISQEEFDTLTIAHKKIQKASDIKQHIDKSMQYLQKYFDTADIFRANGHLQSNFDVYPALADIEKKLENIAIELQDVQVVLQEKQNEISYDLIHHNQEHIEQRIRLYDELCIKYSVENITELLEKQVQCNIQVNHFEEKKKQYDALSEEVKNLREKLESIADNLSKKRLDKIAYLEQYIVSLLEELGIKNSVFTIQKHTVPLNRYGKDSVDFFIQINKNSTPTTLEKVSGGELSRIMFVFKYLVFKDSDVNTVIFDEIDTGISGAIADKMANLIQKMQKAGKQTIVITHSPQIAAKSKIQYTIYKQQSENMTYSNIVRLEDEKQRIREIAKMLSGQSVTQSSIDHAKVLLT